MKMRIGFFTFILLLFACKLHAQTDNTKLIQFSGIVVSSDSLRPIPYASIANLTAKKVVLTDFYGFFSFVAEKGDNVEISALGFKKVYLKIPDSLKNNKYSLVQVLSQDTLKFEGVFLCPWQSYEQFKQEVINLKLPVDDMDRAMKNLALAKLKDKYQPMPNDGGMNFRNLVDQEVARRYYIGGQSQPISLLNPFAWAKFIKAWENGDFKNKD